MEAVSAESCQTAKPPGEPQTVERQSRLTPDAFILGYLARGRPVICTDATASWDTAAWTPEALVRRFGDQQVPLYGDLFDVQSACTLRDYIARYWRSAPKLEGTVPYVRWYSKMTSVDFLWADDCLAELAECWSMPSFLPRTGYLLPAAVTNEVTPNIDPFPAKGLFISGAGARTRLHIDPWCSDAVLCQLHGVKRLCLHPPCSATRHPGQDSADYVIATLRAGEVLFIPADWSHEAVSVEGSVSLTWNFVHMTRWKEFFRCLTSEMNEADRAVLHYFGHL